MVEAQELLDVERCMVFLIDDSCESVGIYLKLETGCLKATTTGSM